MVRTAYLLFGMVLIPAIIIPARAQENPCERRTLPVSVVDKNGNPVDGLTAADFRGKFRGKPVQILSVEPDQRHRRIVILVDASGSMIYPSVWSVVRDISVDAYRSLLGESSIALLAFSGEIRKRVGFESKAGELARMFAALDLEKERKGEERRVTALWDALRAALAELRPANLGDVICVITDGADNHSTIKPAIVERELESSGVRLFAFLISFDMGRAYAPEAIEGADELRRLARKTGGNPTSMSFVRDGLAKESWKSANPRAVTLAKAGRMRRRIDRFYRVGIRPEMMVDRRRDWKLEVMGENGKPRRDLDVHYPQTLLPCRDAAP